MANFISNDKGGRDLSFSMSNGYTTVVLAAILVAGSELAENRWQKLLMVWLAEHDQSIFGSGTVGFDLDEIAWTKENFAKEKSFLLDAVELAQKKHRWEVLGYSPGPKTGAFLKQFADLLDTYLPTYVESDKPWCSKFSPKGVEEFFQDDLKKCPKHDIYMHIDGCLICNDA